MKKFAFYMALLIVSSSLQLKSADELPQPSPKDTKAISLAKEYLQCGTTCPQTYKDAIIKQIARLRNISLKQALAFIALVYASIKFGKWLLHEPDPWVRQYGKSKKPVIL